MNENEPYLREYIFLFSNFSCAILKKVIKLKVSFTWQIGQNQSDESKAKTKIGNFYPKLLNFLKFRENDVDASTVVCIIVQKCSFLLHKWKFDTSVANINKFAPAMSS